MQRSQQCCSLRTDGIGIGPLFLSPHCCSANVGWGTNIWRWDSDLYATGNVGLSSLLWLQRCIPRKSEVCDVNSVPGGQQSSIHRAQSSLTIWHVLTWRRPRSEHRLTPLAGKCSLASGWACCWRVWEAARKPSNILFLENKCFQRPWQASSFNKANFYEGDVSSCNNCVSVIALIQTKAVRVESKVGEKKSWAGSRHSSEDKELLMFLEGVSCSLTSGLWVITQHGATALVGGWSLWVTCRSLGEGWRECMGDKCLFLPISVSNADSSWVLWLCWSRHTSARWGWRQSKCFQCRIWVCCAKTFIVVGLIFLFQPISSSHTQSKLCEPKHACSALLVRADSIAQMKRLYGSWVASLIAIPSLWCHSPLHLSTACHSIEVSLAKAQPRFPFQLRKAPRCSWICRIIPMSTTRTPTPLKLTFLRWWQNWQQWARSEKRTRFRKWWPP